MQINADLLILNIGQLVTCASGGKPKRLAAMRDLHMIENGGVAVVDGEIAAFGSSSEVSGSYRSETTLDAAGVSFENRAPEYKREKRTEITTVFGTPAMK